MLKNTRHEQILAHLKQNNSASVGKLADALKVSDATIRRDLCELEKSGELKRLHGGAQIVKQQPKPQPREKQNLNKKRVIAELACDFVKDGFTLFVDSSSSAGQVISSLQNVKNITVITNGINNCIKSAQNSNIKVLLSGGEATDCCEALVGHKTVEFIKNYCADLCIMSCEGISHVGATESSEYEAEVKRTMLNGAQKRILLCDSSKLNKTCMCKISDYYGFDYLITDSELPNDLKQIVLNSGCKIIK